MQQKILTRLLIIGVFLAFLIFALLIAVFDSEALEFNEGNFALQNLPQQANHLASTQRLDTSIQDSFNEEIDILDYPAYLELREELFQVVQELPPSSCIVVSQGDRELFSYKASIALTPASGHKLKTALAALVILGEDYRYKTQIRAFVEPDEGVIEGNLYLVGSGDPYLWTQDYFQFRGGEAEEISYTPIEELQRQIIDRGITQITGSVVAVENHYDTVRYPVDWPSVLHRADISAPLSALVINNGMNLNGADIFSSRSWRATSNSALSAATLFNSLLQNEGVLILEAPTLTSELPPIVLAEIESPPLKLLLQNMLSVSDNTAAELITKELGFQSFQNGSTQAGIEAIIDALIQADIYSSAPQILPIDGSGIANMNRSTCQELMKILEYTNGRQNSPLLNILSIAGQRGTLKDFLPDSEIAGRLSAKTGTLTGVASLTGFFFGDEALNHNETIRFSYITNHTFQQAFSNNQRIQIEEKILNAILNYLS